MNHQRRRNSDSQTKRCGAALVEFALILPIILVFLFALLEFSRVLMLKHTADTAAYEGARSAIVAGASAQSARVSAESLLQSARIRSWNIKVSPSLIDERTGSVTVHVEIPVVENSWISPFFFQDHLVSSSVSLITERPPAVQLTGVPKTDNAGLGVSVLGLGL